MPLLAQFCLVLKDYSCPEKSIKRHLSKLSKPSICGQTFHAAPLVQAFTWLFIDEKHNLKKNENQAFLEIWGILNSDF